MTLAASRQVATISQSTMKAIPLVAASHIILFGRQGPETRHEVLPPDDASFALFEAPGFRGTNGSDT
jgi:hypothetical protein